MNYILFYILILTSSIIILSYGEIFCRYFKIKTDCISLKIILGSFFIGSITLIINFFYSINFIITNLIFALGLFAFLKHFKKIYNIKLLIPISIISSLTLIFENVYRPDAGLYHLPFISNLNENNIIIGLNNLHSRYGHISFYQYISSAFNNHLFSTRAIFFPLGIIYSSSLVYFYKIAKSENQYPIIRITALLFGLSIGLDMNRFSEFGNDEVSHMIYFILTLNIMFLFSSFYKNKIQNIQIILVLCLFLFLNKTSNAILILIIILIIYNFKKKFHFLNRLNYFLITIFFLWILKNFFNSGCLIYPIDSTCFNNILWANNFASNESLIIEAWAKGYPDSGGSINYHEYIKNFNWLTTWMNNHFLYILSKISILIFLLSPILFFINKNGNKLKKINGIKKILFINVIFLLIWFLKFPVYRFGAGFLITALIIFGINLISNFNKKIFNKCFILSILIIFSVLILKNGKRIFLNYNTDYYDYPFIKIYSDNKNKKLNYIKKNYLNSNSKFYFVTKNNDNCYFSPSPCSIYIDQNFFYKKIFFYNVIYKEKK